MNFKKNGCDTTNDATAACTHVKIVWNIIIISVDTLSAPHP